MGLPKLSFCDQTQRWFIAHVRKIQVIDSHQIGKTIINLIRRDAHVGIAQGIFSDFKLISRSEPFHREFVVGGHFVIGSCVLSMGRLSIVFIVECAKEGKAVLMSCNSKVCDLPWKLRLRFNTG